MALDRLIEVDDLIDRVRAYNPRTNQDLIRAAYDPMLPHAAKDASFALRLFARQDKVQ